MEDLKLGNANSVAQLYIIEGAITIAVGILVMIVLPDFPDTWKALTEEERHVANRRLALDAAEADVDEPGGMSQVRGIKLAFLDPKTWVLAIAYHGITGAAGSVVFHRRHRSHTRAREQS